ncbi:MAG: DNA polymerase III subunit gamma/tau C-terminal domain-containing protein, partial [Curvibacter sp.]
PMAPQTVLSHLTSVLQAENVAAEPGALRLLARAARGSMRDALSLTDQAIAFGSGQLEEATVRQMLGSVDRSHVFRLIDALAQGDGRTVVETAEALRGYGLSAASTLEEMTVVLQRMAVLQAVPGGADSADPEAAETARLAALLPADETQLLYSLCLHGRGELGLAPDEYAALTMVLLRLLAFKPGAMPSGGSSEKKTLKSPQATARPQPETAAPARTQPLMAATQVVARPASSVRAEPVEALRQAQGERSTPTPPVAARPIAAPAAAPVARPPDVTPPGQVLSVVDEEHPVQPARPVTAMSTAQVVAVPVRVTPESRADAPAPGASQGSPLVPTEEGGYWHQVVRGLIASEAITALVRELALQSQLVARDADQWLLRVERESLNSASSRERLQAALQAAGHPITLAVEIGRVSDSPARRNAAIAEEKQLAAEKLIHEDPFVQAMMRDFGAKIVPGSIKPIEPNSQPK